MGASAEEINHAVRMVVDRYGEMVHAGRREFYGSTERMIQAAADELVAEVYLTPELAKVVVPGATAFLARAGRR